MNLPHSTIATGSRALAIALTVFLFVAGSFPAAGQAFPGDTHWVAHLAAYALIAFAYGLGWQKQPALLVAGFVAALGAIHEYSEIFTPMRGASNYQKRLSSPVTDCATIVL
jgi:hypothetical protein